MKSLLLALGWLVLISALHSYLNVNWVAVLNNYRPIEKRRITVAYIPVTCQLTCPVTDYISKYSQSGEEFLPLMFEGFPEMKEALISNRVQAAFIVAPMALALTWDTATGAPSWFKRTAPSKHSRICVAIRLRYRAAFPTSDCLSSAP
jgi:hypothetical protein